MISGRLQSWLRRLWGTFINSPLQWTKLEHCDVLVFDRCGLDFLAPYLNGFTVTALPVRGELLNVRALAKALGSREFWTGKFHQAYFDSYIRLVSPRLIITYIDNNPAFYTISRRFPEIKTAFLQNGTRGPFGDIFNWLQPSPSYHVDHMLVHGEAIGLHYAKYVSGQWIAAGTLRNNSIPKGAHQKYNAIAYVSQYHEKPQHNGPLWLEPDGTPVHWEDFTEADRRIVQFLDRWCSKKGKQLKVFARSLSSRGEEYDFYSANLKECNWEFVIRDPADLFYRLLDAVEIVVFIDSTLGYEALGRGTKIASFSCRLANRGDTAHRFGWPADYEDTGIFWTNLLCEAEFEKVIDGVDQLTREQWNGLQKEYGKQLMAFDAGNSEFKAILASIS